MTRPRHSLTMTLAAGAIALAGIGAAPRPAQADTEDLLRFLAGAIVIAAIVNAVDDNHRPAYAGRWVLPDSCIETVRVNRRNVDVYHAGCLDRAGYTRLPQECRYDYRYEGRNRSGYVAECMYDAGYRPQHGGGVVVDPVPQTPVLPSRCEMTYRQAGQRIDGYWGSCLENAGFHDLPRYCRVVSTDGQSIYNAECLSNANYRRR